MPEPQFKRNIAYKIRIDSILNNTPIMNGERFGFLEFNGKKVVRVNVIGSIVDKYESEGEKKFVFLKIDDGSGQISLKSFGDDVEKLKNITLGKTVLVIGNLRHFNDEIYIAPEILKEQDPKYLLVRKIELEGNEEKIQTNEVVEVENKETSMKGKILEMIKNSESEGGIETEKLISSLNEPKEKVNEEIQRLLEEGIIFEPLPGKLRWLG
mgnify:CR=1 FL=1